MSELPCKKCLKLACCKYKKDIQCNDLYNTFRAIDQHLDISPWPIIEQTLPNLQHLDTEVPDEL